MELDPRDGGRVNSKVVTLRIPEDRLARINERAKASGLSRSQYVLDRADPEGRTERLTNPAAMVAPTVACTHPRASRKVLGYATICEVCGGRVR